MWILGQERASRKIASKICQSREKQTIESTKELSDLILSCVSKKSKKHPATNSFRAIRMFVNNEIQELQKVLEAASYVLCCGGRLAIISFHSMEDRIVKRFMKMNSFFLFMILILKKKFMH